VARTQEARKAETRERLLAAAADQFARKGFHGVSAEAVADAADRTTGALYSHFGNKEGLVLALLEAWRDQTVTEIEAELEAAPDVDRRLVALWERFSPDPGDRGDAWQLLEHELWLFAARSSDASAQLAARYEHDRENLGRGLQQFAAAEHTTLPLPIDDESVLALGLLLGLAMQHRLDPDRVPATLVVRGLRTLLGLPLDDTGAVPAATADATA
jgi:AcrR family transcriptional regulator